MLTSPSAVSKLPAFRAEHFPYAGPSPWLDRDGAEKEIARRIDSGVIGRTEAERCRYWAKNGAFVYHDLAASRSRQQYIGACLLRDEEGQIRLFNGNGEDKR